MSCKQLFRRIYHSAHGYVTMSTIKLYLGYKLKLRQHMYTCILQIYKMNRNITKVSGELHSMESPQPDKKN